MNGHNLVLTRNAASASEPNPDGLFAVCQNRNNNYPDATYIFYCDLRDGSATPGAGWEDQARCEYVMGNIDGENDDDTVLGHAFIRDIAIVDSEALDSATWVYDLLLTEGKYPESSMGRYRVKVTTDASTAQPTVVVCGEDDCSLSDVSAPPARVPFLMASLPSRSPFGKPATHSLQL